MAGILWDRQSLTYTSIAGRINNARQDKKRHPLLRESTLFRGAEGDFVGNFLLCDDA
jgi:hypothetical protein